MEFSEEEELIQKASKWRITIDCNKMGHEEFISIVCLDHDCKEEE